MARIEKDIENLHNAISAVRFPTEGNFQYDQFRTDVLRVLHKRLSNSSDLELEYSAEQALFYVTCTYQVCLPPELQGAVKYGKVRFEFAINPHVDMAQQIESIGKQCDAVKGWHFANEQMLYQSKVATNA